jgi:mycothiol synthase
VLQQTPTYRPELDLVAVGPDGMFVAYCVAWCDEANQIGMFGPVGTHRAYWRRGLGKALMREGLLRLEALGARMAYVDCDLDPAANRLYESAGFTDYDRVYHWQKE